MILLITSRLLLSLVALAAGAASQTDPEIDQLVAMLQDPDQRELALAGLKQHGEAAVPPVMAALEESSTRVGALIAIEHLGLPFEQAVPLLIELVRGDSKPEKWLAALALGRVGPEGAKGVAALIDALLDEDYKVRLHSAKALRLLGPTASPALPVLSRCLEDPLEEVRLEAAYAIVTLDPEARDKALLVIYDELGNEAGDNRGLALDALRYVEPAPEQAIPLVTNILRRGEGDLLIRAATTLAIINPFLARPCVPLLIEALEHEESYYRYLASLTLGNIGPAASGSVPWLEAALEDEAQNVRTSAQEALERIQSPGLTSFSHRDLDLKAIVNDPKGSRAVFLTPETDIYFAVVGWEFMDGVVSEIGPDQVVVREKTVDREFNLQEVVVEKPLFVGNELPEDLEQARDDDISVSLNMQDDDLLLALWVMADAGGLNVVVEPKVTGRLSLVVPSGAWNPVLEHILKTNDLGYSVEGRFVRVAKAGMVGPELRRRDFAGDLVDLNFIRGSLKDVVELLVGEVAGLELVFEANIDYVTTVFCRGVSWDEALAVILRSHGLTYSIEGSVVRVHREE